MAKERSDAAQHRAVTCRGTQILHKDLIRTRGWTGFSPCQRRCSQRFDQLILATHVLNVVVGELFRQSRLQFAIFHSLLAIRSEIVAQS